jgi:thioredoxin 1
MAKPTVVTDETFDKEVLGSPGPVLVDFWAPWCGPCRLVAPVMEELAQEMEGRVSFAKLNVDENPRTAPRYSIQAIPTLILFKEGKPVKQFVGYKPKGELKKSLEEALGPASSRL